MRCFWVVNSQCSLTASRCRPQPRANTLCIQHLFFNSCSVKLINFSMYFFGSHSFHHPVMTQMESMVAQLQMLDGRIVVSVQVGPPHPDQYRPSTPGVTQSSTLRLIAPTAPDGVRNNCPYGDSTDYYIRISDICILVS